jgi:hypothetical protein
MGQRVFVFSILVGCGALPTVSLVRQMAPGSGDPISPVAMLIAVPAALAFVIALLFRPQSESGFFSIGVTCLRTGLSYSVQAIRLLAGL